MSHTKYSQVLCGASLYLHTEWSRLESQDSLVHNVTEWQRTRLFSKKAKRGRSDDKVMLWTFYSLLLFSEVPPYSLWPGSELFLQSEAKLYLHLPK